MYVVGLLHVKLLLLRNCYTITCTVYAYNLHLFFKVLKLVLLTYYK